MGSKKIKFELTKGELDRLFFTIEDYLSLIEKVQQSLCDFVSVKMTEFKKIETLLEKIRQRRIHEA